jgi:hypothetical protein
MKNIKTPPMVGDEILENIKNNFLEKHGNEQGQIGGIKIWPAAAIEKSYRKAAGEIDGPNEAQALKTFYAEMLYYLRTGTYIDFDLDNQEIILALHEGKL